MPQQLFLSHDTRDQAIAKALGASIQRLTLGQILVWHSSDSAGSGGLRPGHVWLDEIRTQLARSKAVVALLTPRSLAKPWLLFESGFGAANPECDVIPVCVGIDSLASIPFPLAMYQAYQLADYDSVKRFLEKLLAKYDIVFDEEMSKPVLSELIKKLVSEPNTSHTRERAGTAATLESALDGLKAHIDMRLMEIISNQSGNATRPRVSSFSISLDLREFTPSAADQYLEVSSEVSVQDVLDSIYYLIPDMPSFQYLNRWLLRDSTTGVNLIIREVAPRVPAYIIFSPGSHWQIIKLDKPYSPSDSQDLGRWYGNI